MGKESTTQATIYPPAMMPGFMGMYAPIKGGYGSLYNQKSINFFQDYRNEVLARFTMPPYHWGFTRTPYSPRADLVAADKKCNLNRGLNSQGVKVRLIDAAREAEVQNFYTACQMHRDQYKDHTGCLHPLQYFRRSDYLWQCPASTTSMYMEFPYHHVEYKRPIVAPTSYGRTTLMPSLPERALVGRFWPNSDNLYNR